MIKLKSICNMTFPCVKKTLEIPHSGIFWKDLLTHIRLSLPIRVYQ